MRDDRHSKKTKNNSDVRNKINDLKMVLNQISYYVGVTHIKKSGILNEINIYSRGFKNKNSSNLSITSKSLIKDLKFIIIFYFLMG